MTGSTAELIGHPNRRLFEMIKAGKSLVFISAKLKRPVKTVRDRKP
jgi:hypothetical protein